MCLFLDTFVESIHYNLWLEMDVLVLGGYENKYSQSYLVGCPNFVKNPWSTIVAINY